MHGSNACTRRLPSDASFSDVRSSLFVQASGLLYRQHRHIRNQNILATRGCSLQILEDSIPGMEIDQTDWAVRAVNETPRHALDAHGPVLLVRRISFRSL